jgi:mRNA-degrading endonuclease RelE of RelBE toxin-antitoxin system
MAWAIEYDKAAEKEIAKLDRQIAQRIIQFRGSRVGKLENPDSRLVVLVVRVGNRRAVYR